MQAFKKKFKELVYSMSTEDHYAEYDEDDQHADFNNNPKYTRGNSSQSDSNSSVGNFFGSFGKKNNNANVNIHNLASSSVLSLPEDNAGTSNSPYDDGNEDSNYSTGVSTGHFFEQPPKNSFTYNADLEHSGSNIQLSVVDSDSARQYSEQHQDGVSEVLLAWKHIDSWCTENSPDLSASLDNPCTRNDLTGAEQDLNISFPPSVRASLRVHDGQEELDSYSGVSGLIYGLPLMSLDNIVSMTFAWRNVATNLQKSQKLKQDSKIFKNSSSSTATGQTTVGGENFKLNEIPKQGSIPPNTVQPVYAHHGWIPLVTDNAGNHIAIDLAPAPEGKVGQVIMFGRDFDVKFVVADNWGDFLLAFANDLIVGNWYLLSDNDYGDILSGEGELVFRDKQHNSTIVEDYMTVLKKRSWVAWKKRVDQQQANTVNEHNPQPQPVAPQQRHTPQSQEKGKVVTKKNKDIVVHEETPRKSISDDAELKDVAEAEKTTSEPLVDTSVETVVKDETKAEPAEKELPKEAAQKQSDVEPVKKESAEKSVKEESAQEFAKTKSIGDSVEEEKSEETVPVKESTKSSVSESIEIKPGNEVQKKVQVEAQEEDQEEPAEEPHKKAELLDENSNEQKPVKDELESALETKDNGEIAKDETETESQPLKELKAVASDSLKEESEDDLKEDSTSKKDEKLDIEKADKPSVQNPKEEETTEIEATSDAKDENELAEKLEDVAL
ncbi:hypothetical protein ACO0QE_001713 [Hanseniaspora vineae]